MEESSEKPTKESNGSLDVGRWLLLDYETNPIAENARSLNAFFSNAASDGLGHHWKLNQQTHSRDEGSQGDPHRSEEPQRWTDVKTGCFARAEIERTKPLILASPWRERSNTKRSQMPNLPRICRFFR